MSHESGDASALLSVKRRHLRLPEGSRVELTEAGRLAVPLILCEWNGRVDSVPFLMTADEAVALRDLLGRLLAGRQAGDAG